MNEEVHVERTYAAPMPSRVRRASWGAIFGGMFVTIVLQVMFTLLGLGVGIATLQPAQQQTSAQTMATASGIWLLVTGLISIWVGSCVAGRLSGGPRRADGLLHGIITWAVSTVAMFFLLATTVGSILGGTGALVQSAISSRTSAEGGQNNAQSFEQQAKNLFPQAGALLPPTGRNSGQQTPGNLTALAEQDPDLATALGRMEANGGARAQQERDQVVNILTTKHNLNQQDAANLVNEWDRQFQQAHAQLSQKTQQVGQAASKGIEWGSFWGFIALILGLLVSSWGGWAGTASLPLTETTVRA